jgi:hypothetical protein
MIRCKGEIYPHDEKGRSSFAKMSVLLPTAKLARFYPRLRDPEDQKGKKSDITRLSRSSPYIHDYISISSPADHTDWQKEENNCSTQDSRVVPHRSTD